MTATQVTLIVLVFLFGVFCGWMIGMVALRHLIETGYLEVRKQRLPLPNASMNGERGSYPRFAPSVARASTRRRTRPASASSCRSQFTEAAAT
jgi:polyferredoxin